MKTTEKGKRLIKVPKTTIIIATTMPGQAPKPLPREFSGYNGPIIGQPAMGPN